MKQKQYKLVVVGIDQSYTRTGISIAADGKLLKVSSLNFKGCRTKTEKRNQLFTLVHKILLRNKNKAKRIVVICERIRTFSGRGKQFMNINYIKATGALIAAIVDAAYSHNIPVYSVATNSWKAQIVGSARAKNKDNKKQETIDYICQLGFTSSILSYNRKDEAIYNDDAADSACIALYGFLESSRKKLKKED